MTTTVAVTDQPNETIFPSLQQILALVPGHLYWKNRDGVLMGCNDEQARYLGYKSGADIIGKTDYELPWKDRADHMRATDLRVMETGETFIAEEPGLKPENTFLSKKTPLRDSAGNIVGILGNSIDITQLKQQERALLIEKQKAEAANQSKTNFLTTMSHELRTPLNVIMGTTQLLMREHTDDAQSRDLENIFSQSKLLLRLVNDILDFSKLELHVLSLEKQPFSLCDLIQSVMTSAVSTNTNPNITIDYHCDEHLPEQVLGDPLRLKQALSNLTTNAIKFTEHGSIRLSADYIETTSDRFIVQVHITDTGIGIAPEHIDKIFEDFYQIKQAQTTTQHGTGIGLSICKRIIELMDGHIEVKSEINKGTEFILTLPFEMV